MPVPASAWFAGTTRRPARVWMPMPGPVAYHVHSGRLTPAVISAGADHVAPSSVLFITHTVREPSLVPAMMSFSRSVPRFWVVSSQSVPVFRSRTGHGLPMVFGPLSPITCRADQVRPSSRLRLRTRSMSPASPPPARRASANASSVPLRAAINAGIRNV